MNVRTYKHFSAEQQAKTLERLNAVLASAEMKWRAAEALLEHIIASVTSQDYVAAHEAATKAKKDALIVKITYALRMLRYNFIEVAKAAGKEEAEIEQLIAATDAFVTEEEEGRYWNEQLFMILRTM